MGFHEPLYSDEDFHMPTLESLQFSSISLDLKQWLESEFEEKEITKVLNDCAGDKAHASDDYIAFVKPSWSFLHKKFCSILSELHRRDRLHKEINAIFLTLIPKVPNPSNLKGSKPISLVGCIYKLLAKVLANRSKVDPPLIISHVHGAFVKERHIIDGILIANELNDSRKRSNKECVIFKIDLERPKIM